LQAHGNSNVNEVELLPDGGWRIVEDKPPKKQIVNGVVGSSAPSSVAKPASVESRKQEDISAPTSSKPPQSAPDIITIDDSDDDNDANSDIPSVPASNPTPAPSSVQQESRKRTYDQVSSSGDKQQDIITLSDSDDDEEQRSPIQPHVNQTFGVTANIDSKETAFSLLDSKHLFDNTDDESLSSLDPADAVKISNALYKFMEALQNDNKNYNS